MRRMDVHEAANRRLKIIFDYFDYVYVSFSGGKDSGILLHLCMDYIRMHAPGRKLGVFHMDYEVQYRQSTEYVEGCFPTTGISLKCSTVVSPSSTHMYFHVPAVLASLARGVPEYLGSPDAGHRSYRERF